MAKLNCPLTFLIKFYMGIWSFSQTTFPSNSCIWVWLCDRVLVMGIWEEIECEMPTYCFLKEWVCTLWVLLLPIRWYMVRYGGCALVTHGKCKYCGWLSWTVMWEWDKVQSTVRVGFFYYDKLSCTLSNVIQFQQKSSLFLFEFFKRKSMKYLKKKKNH